MLSVFLLMMLMSLSGTLAMAIPWMVGYFYIFWLKPAVNMEHGIRWVVETAGHEWCEIPIYESFHKVVGGTVVVLDTDL